MTDCTFSYFLHTRNWIELKVFSDYYLVIRRINDTTSELYFRDNLKDHIEIPLGVLVMISNTNILNLPNLSKTYFLLSSDQDYTVTINDSYLFSLKKRCDWTIDADFQIVNDDNKTNVTNN